MAQANQERTSHSMEKTLEAYGEGVCWGAGELWRAEEPEQQVVL